MNYDNGPDPSHEETARLHGLANDLFNTAANDNISPKDRAKKIRAMIRNFIPLLDLRVEPITRDTFEPPTQEQKDIKSLFGSRDEMAAQIAALTEDFRRDRDARIANEEALTVRVNRLQTCREEMSATIHNLTTRLADTTAAFNARIDEHRGLVSATRDRLTEIDAKISDLDARLKTVAAANSVTFQQHDRRGEDLSARVNALADQVRKFDFLLQPGEAHANRLTTIEERIANLARCIDEIHDAPKPSPLTDIERKRLTGAVRQYLAGDLKLNIGTITPLIQGHVEQLIAKKMPEQVFLNMVETVVNKQLGSYRYGGSALGDLIRKAVTECVDKFIKVHFNMSIQAEAPRLTLTTKTPETTPFNLPAQGTEPIKPPTWNEKS